MKIIYSIVAWLEKKPLPIVMLIVVVSMGVSIIGMQATSKLLVESDIKACVASTGEFTDYCKTVVKCVRGIDEYRCETGEHKRVKELWLNTP
jgi:hypothetical protein